MTADPMSDLSGVVSRLTAWCAIIERPPADGLSVDAEAATEHAADLRLVLDKIEGLEADLFLAVQTAYDRGAVEWACLNYPQWWERLSVHPPRLSACSPPEGWRGMASCPSDGTDVLVAWSNGDVERRESDGAWWRLHFADAKRKPIAWMPYALPKPALPAPKES